MDRARYGTTADWRDTVTNTKISKAANNKHVDTFRQRQQQLAS